MSAIRLKQLLISSLLIGLCIGVSASQVQDISSITGYWDINDKNGNLDTTIEIYPTDDPNLLEAQVVKLHRPQDHGAICTACGGDRHNQPILTMKVVTELKLNSKKNGWYGNGLDPDRGWEPRVRLRVEGNELKVCAHYKTDIICVDRDNWFRRQPDQEFLANLLPAA